jgi:phosphatidylethanolamine-binding protein (PEBP) family uncharacterized protein
VAKITSARLVLALVIAALAVSGCGGSSDSGTESGETATGSAGKSSASGGPESSQASSGQEGSHAQANKGEQDSSVPQPKGSQEPAPTSEQRQKSLVANIALTSPALRPSAGSVAKLPAAYTCDGNDSWPALSWKAVPEDTAELTLLVMSLKPVNGKIFFDWAVSGLDPGLESLQAGALPDGAVQGKNSFGHTGYSICPAKGEDETYYFALYALPKKLPQHQGFDPSVLREGVNRLAGNVGLMAASYARG